MYSYAQCEGMCVSVCKIAFNHDTDYYKDVQIPWIYSLFSLASLISSRNTSRFLGSGIHVRGEHAMEFAEFKQEFSYTRYINDTRANVESSFVESVSLSRHSRVMKIGSIRSRCNINEITSINRRSIRNIIED